MYRTTERVGKWDFSAPVFTENIAVFMRKDANWTFNEFSDLNGRTIGTVRGWSYGESFDTARAIPLLTAEDTQSDRHNLRKLAGRRLDATSTPTRRISHSPKAVGGRLCCNDSTKPLPNSSVKEKLTGFSFWSSDVQLRPRHLDWPDRVYNLHTGKLTQPSGIHQIHRTTRAADKAAFPQMA